MLWKVQKRNTAGEAESKGQSSASCTVYCPARSSSTTQKGAWLPRRVYVHTYVHPRTYTFVRPYMRGHEQHPQSRSGLPHNACISLVIYISDFSRINCTCTCVSCSQNMCIMCTSLTLHPPDLPTHHSLLSCSLHTLSTVPLSAWQRARSSHPPSPDCHTPPHPPRCSSSYRTWDTDQR